MAPKIDQEARMTVKVLAQKGVSHCATARHLGVTEGAVRYHLRRQAAGAIDGRSLQQFRAAPWREAIEVYFGQRDGRRVNLAELHEWLTTEHAYVGSLRSIERYCAARCPKPRVRARRRVETPPGAQAQADWAEYRSVVIAGDEVDLYAFGLELSYSRKDTQVWSPRKDQISWQHVHNESFRRIEGVPATVRVDNEKTAVSRGAGAWGEVNPDYRRYAVAVRFHVDACPPRAPQCKGKIERRIRDQRRGCDPYARPWDSLAELQAATDAALERSAKRRMCPATGTSVEEAFELEKPHLAPLPILPEPFDVVVTRVVGIDCMVAFEGRSYSVPFAHVGQAVEVRGCASRVQVLARGQVVADHARGTRERIVIDARHFEGEATDAVIPPPPLGRMGRRLAEIHAMEPQKRPIDLYAELAEVAR
jgi:transposase